MNLRPNPLHLLAVLIAMPLFAQDNPTAESADVEGRIIIDTRGERPKPPVFYGARIESIATVNRERITTEAAVVMTPLQGAGDLFRLGLRGTDRVLSVTGDTVASWAIRQEGEVRSLDVSVKAVEGAAEHRFVVKLESGPFAVVPASVDLSHFAPAGKETASFHEVVTLAFTGGAAGRVLAVEGFLPIENPDGSTNASRYQTTTGGRLALQVNRSGLTPEAVELNGITLTGKVEATGKTAEFVLRGTAKVSEPGASVTILSGNAALTSAPEGPGGKLVLAQESGAPVLRLLFPGAGEFPLDLTFVAAVTGDGPWRRLDFTVGSAAVTPLSLSGLAEETEFTAAGGELLPEHQNGNWIGFLPAGGRARLAWKASRPAEDGKLFFTTNALVETQLGAGLLRQDHHIDYRILQGSIEKLILDLEGEGEVLAVEGAELTAWNVVAGEGSVRRLEVTLARPLEGATSLRVRTQTPLDGFPVRVKAVRLTPQGAVRHAGHVRLSNLGSVRLQPAVTTGLAQLSPEQYPGEAMEARQIFVYRFPSADYELDVVADRVQPEVGISQLVTHEITATDRLLNADLELDIREAPIREWIVEFPADYSLVSATGATLTDFLVATEAVEGRKKLTLLFGGEVTGRQLVTLSLEKSEVAVAGSWVLPRLEFPEAKTIRGDIGVAGAHGFRVTTESSDLLVEKPLSYFPKPTPRLQQAFRIREPGWTATMKVEPLEKSVSADVFHLYSLSEGRARASVVLNYFVTGAPVPEWELTVPADLVNVGVEGQNVRTWRRDGEKLIVTLHQPVIGPSTLLVTFEETIGLTGGTLVAGRVAPLGVADERGYVEVVSPGQVKAPATKVSPELLALDPLELPAEFRLLSAAPSQGVWQYTGRPFELAFLIGWYEPGTTVPQAVEFAEAETRVSEGGGAVTDLVYYVKSRSRSALDLRLPAKTGLWSVSVAGAPVNARQDGEITRIPLPGSADPDTPVEVRLRLGRESDEGSVFDLALPRVGAPVLKTEWRLAGEEKRSLYPVGGTVAPPVPVRPPTGFTSLFRHGLLALSGVILLALVGVTLTRSHDGTRRFVGLVSLAGAVILAVGSAFAASGRKEMTGALRVSLPLLPADAPVELSLRSVPNWQVAWSWAGLGLIVTGIVTVIVARRRGEGEFGSILLTFGIAAAIAGLLWQRESDGLFFGLLALLIAVGWFLPRMLDAWRERPRRKRKAATEAAQVVSLLVISAIISGLPLRSEAQVSAPGLSVARSVQQKAVLRHGEAKLRVEAVSRFAGKPGDTFLLLQAPAVLTNFTGGGLNLSRQTLDGSGDAKAYLVTIAGTVAEGAPEVEVTATFSYEIAVPDAAAGVLLPTGPAAFAEIEVRHDRPGWEFSSDRAVRSRPLEGVAATESAAVLLLAPGAPATLTLRPKARDLASEKTLFYVEGDQIYLPGPGVLDGRHRFRVRPSQGRVSSLNLQVPPGLTVSELTGPVTSWQFDADAGALSLAIEPPQTEAFEIVVATQRGLGALPVDLELAPLRVTGAAGEVGLVALAFGPDAQPENAAATGMSEVNPGDFDAALIAGEGTTLHRVFRYGADEGELTVKVNAVDPEVRVTSRQVLSFGEERIVLSVELAVEITRAGLFQLGFTLPEGFEVESLTGSALQQWSELTEDGKREVVMHLNGRTLGQQTFSITLAGTTPAGEEDWVVPNLQLHEAARQAGQLVVRPAEGIRLRSAERLNLSEVDPREVGGDAKDALAFRLLQRDWSLTLGVEKLEPWITGQVLHEVTLREGQTRTALAATLKVENAAIRELRVRIPGLSEDEIRTLRASGPAVGDLVRVAPDSNEWDIRFQRRLIGEARVHLEFERRGERGGGKESLLPVEFPSVRQPAYFFAVRSAGRLELETGTLPTGWQNTEWSAVPSPLREAGGDHSAPALALRATAPTEPALVEATRHSLAESLKLRVAGGRLTTVLSTAGDELTSVDLTMEVVQRSSLTVGLPPGGELFHLFVNGETVHSVKLGDAWQFFILPGADDRTAAVSFAYVVPGAASGRKPGKVDLASPSLGVPMENLVWDVILPPGMELTHEEGDLEPREVESRGIFDRTRYLAESQALREDQNRRASALLEQANALIQSGDQTRARQALSSVANGFAIDAASNEDARVQLENLRTQQAVVGLNTRRQRLVLDHESGGVESSVVNDQLKQGAAANRVLNEGDVNFRPEELVQLLQGNSSDDNATLQRIAGKIIRQQQGEEALARPMGLVLPSEGMVYRFVRALQVEENAPLDLELRFAPAHRVPWWRLVVGTVLLFCVTLFLTAKLAVRDSGAM